MQIDRSLHLTEKELETYISAVWNQYLSDGSDYTYKQYRIAAMAMEHIKLVNALAYGYN